MHNRRNFVKGVAAASAGCVALLPQPAFAPVNPTEDQFGPNQRRYGVGVLDKVGRPVLEALSRRELRKAMPVETAGSAEKLKRYTHLEAISRLLVGIAAWLQAPDLRSEEKELQQKFAALARECLDAATDPKSPDFMNFSEGQQPLVDTAFLAQAIIRAPGTLWKNLDFRPRKQLVSALEASRVIVPINNNHVLFAAVIEAALLSMEQSTRQDRLEDYLRQMLAWYRGDGLYADGEYFRFDYYNSFVIHPTLLDIFGLLRQKDRRFEDVYVLVLRRARRCAEIQERLIGPDGTFPSVGRSITYRFGAFQTLGQIALLRELPERIAPGQVRCALTAVIRRMMGAPGTFDENGWLRVGFCGHQVALGETYVSTGSLYLCSAGLLPLGLPPSDAFWSEPPARWTSQRLWAGETLSADRALREENLPEFPNLRR
jgi:hypothetical protein